MLRYSKGPQPKVLIGWQPPQTQIGRACPPATKRLYAKLSSVTKATCARIASAASPSPGDTPR